MRFSTLALLSAVAQCSSAFMPSFRPHSFVSVSHAAYDNGPSVQLRMAMEDLEAKLLSDDPKKAPKKASMPVQKSKSKSKAEPKKDKKEDDSLKSLLASPGPAPETISKPVAAKASKPVPEKVSKSRPAPTPKTRYEVDTPFEKEAPRAVVPKAAPRITPKPKAKPAKEAKSRNAISPPKVNVPSASDPNAKTLGLALGAAPLLVAPIVALGAGRSLLTKTAARRELIQKEIAEAKAAKEKKRIQAETDGGALAKAVGFLGAGGAALVLILSNPFAGIEGPSGFNLDVPFASPAATTSVTTPKKQVKDPSGYKLDVAAPAERRAAKAQKVEAAKAEAAKEQKAARTAAKAEAAKAAAAAKAEKDAAKAEAAAAKAKTKEEAAAAAAKVKTEKQAAAKAEREAVEAKAAAERKSAKAEDAAAKVKVEQKAAAKAEEAEKKAAEEAKAKAEKDAASKDTDTREKKGTEAVEARKAAPAPAPAPAPAKKSDLVAEPPKTNPAVIKDPNAEGVGVVAGGAGGGRVLPKEEVSTETLDFLKNYKNK